MTIRYFLGIGPNEEIPYYEIVERKDPNTESVQEVQEVRYDHESVMKENQEFMDALERSI